MGRDEVLTLASVADDLHCSKGHVSNLIRGRVPGLKGDATKRVGMSEAVDGASGFEGRNHMQQAVAEGGPSGMGDKETAVTSTKKKQYTVQEASRILGLPVTWLYERTRKNAIPFHRYGKYVRFTDEDLEAIVNNARLSPMGAS